MQVNPIGLVTVKGASKCVKQPRSLTVEQFCSLVSHLREPFGTIALMCICFGLRISECLAFRWSDFDGSTGDSAWMKLKNGLQPQSFLAAKACDSR